MNYTQKTYEEIEAYADTFSKENGGDENGIIPDGEFDEIFDHMADSLSELGKFVEGFEEESLFSSSRYVDQIPFIGVTVEQPGYSVKRVLEKALKCVETSKRPFGVMFDDHPDYYATFPNIVFGTRESISDSNVFR